MIAAENGDRPSTTAFAMMLPTLFGGHHENL